MQVLTFPAIYGGDLTPLYPYLYEGDGGELVLQIKFGPHVNLELVHIFADAIEQNCQWVQLLHKPLIEMNRRWINISGKFLSPASATTDVLSGFGTTASGMQKYEPLVVA